MVTPKVILLKLFLNLLAFRKSYEGLELASGITWTAEATHLVILPAEELCPNNLIGITLGIGPIIVYPSTSLVWTACKDLAILVLVLMRNFDNPSKSAKIVTYCTLSMFQLANTGTVELLGEVYLL